MGGGEGQEGMYPKWKAARHAQSSTLKLIPVMVFLDQLGVRIHFVKSREGRARCSREQGISKGDDNRIGRTGPLVDEIV